MDPRLVQRTRYLLQARVRRAKSCPSSLFPSACAHLLDWVRHHPILAGMCAELGQEGVTFAEGVQSAKDLARHPKRSLNPVVAGNVREHAALCLKVLDAVVDGSRLQAPGADKEDVGADEGPVDVEFLLKALSALITGRWESPDEAIERLRDIAVDGFYEFIDEGIDSRNAVMGLLIKYQQRSEWFHRQRLRELAKEGAERRRPGEESLAVDLQEYVFDQGVEFAIEPLSASGAADLILRDVDGAHVVLDAKYIPAGAQPYDYKDKLARGFHQVARYCHDFHEPAGYLVVFIEDTKLPRLPVELTDGFEYVTVKGKQVYYVPVVIADSPTASKAGVAQQVDVSIDDIIKFAIDANPGPPPTAKSSPAVGPP